MSTRKSTMFYGVLIALSSLVVGMVMASRLGLSPMSFASSLSMPDANSAPLSGPIDATTFRTIAQQTSPAVVSIITSVPRRAQSIDEMFGFETLPPQFRNQVPRRPQQPRGFAQGAGSGFIIDAKGFILTNNHVVDDATRIEVKIAGMEDEGNLSAKVIGTDVLSDTALIQLTELPDRPLPVVKFGDSAQLAPGDWVMAIGNPFNLSNTVTVGVVSAVGRPQQTAVAQRFEEMIQTDAAINRGNSGGPLLNLRGEVVGINTQILSDQTGSNLGIGFAVPINTVREVLPNLEKGEVVRGRIGVEVRMEPLTRADALDFGLPSPKGAVIMLVGEGPAKIAGVRAGDVVVEFNGKPVQDSGELVNMVTRTAPGTTVPVKLYRAKKVMTLNVKVEQLDLAVEQERVARIRQEPDAAPAPQEAGFGITINALTPALRQQLSLPAGQNGAVVTQVDPGSAADLARVLPGDIITEVNDKPTPTVNDVSAALDAVAQGRSARIKILRRGQETLAIVRKQ
jgi:serine protease Do